MSLAFVIFFSNMNVIFNLYSLIFWFFFTLVLWNFFKPDTNSFYFILILFCGVIHPSHILHLAWCNASSLALTSHNNYSVSCFFLLWFASLHPFVYFFYRLHSLWTNEKNSENKTSSHNSFLFSIEIYFLLFSNGVRLFLFSHVNLKSFIINIHQLFEWT